MYILVTGGIGQIGRTAVSQLLRHKHSVRILDRAAEADIDPEVRAEIEGASYAQVDITDFTSLAPHFAGADAVVHLAALTTPGAGPEHVLFQINVNGTFNVYRAAADAGIQRVVSASSINALGYNYGIKSFDIEYFPIDEMHPTFTTDPYSFSKDMVEEIAGYFWRREGISGAALRFPGVYRRNPQGTGRGRLDWRRMFREAAESFSALPEEERMERMATVIAQLDAMRVERPHEQPPEEQRRQWEARRQQGPPPPEMMLAWGRTDFWASMDDRDAAQAIEKALTVDYEGAHTLFVNDSHNSVGIPTQELTAMCFPQVKTWKQQVLGTETLVSIDKARELLGFEPAYSISLNKEVP
ncbi:MAG: NAD(P)-dependent oxidoreductase [Anaerolineales bacterium]|nr:MAG: NAD(P)-dependent oxidoreductase [Anaerolineales bacterium]